MQRDMACLKDGVDFDGERLPASAAIPQTGPRRFALHAGRFADCAAMRTRCAIGPQPRLDVGDGGVFAGEMFDVECGFHGGLPC